MPLVVPAVKPVFKQTNLKHIEYGIFGEGSQICRYCLRRKGLKSQLLAGEGSQISLFCIRTFGGRRVSNHNKLAGEGSQMTILHP